jgi:hypothetical protein
MRKLLVSSLVVISAITTVPAKADADTLRIVGGVLLGAVVMNEINAANRPKYPQSYEIRNGGYGTIYNPVPYGNVPQAPVMVNGTVYAAPPCDDVYYEGQYNPGAARMYCQGVRVRYARDIQRQQQEAYARGAGSNY